MILAIKILLLLVAAYAVFQVARMRLLVERGKRVAKNAVQFQRVLPNAPTHILVAGDSTALGTGASSPEESTAGRLGVDYPEAEIINLSRNGKKLEELLRDFQRQRLGHFKLAVLQIGANDIVYLTPLPKLRSDLEALLAQAKKRSPTVLLLHSGNIGAAPLFPWPVSAFYTARTRRVRALYQELAAKHGAHYVDLFHERRDYLFVQNPKKYYLEDLYHPSSEGYALWHKKIKATLDEIGWNR